MTNYEKYDLPCWTLANYQEGNSMLRTTFDSGTVRQRRKGWGLPTSSFRIILKNRRELEKWTVFWADLHMGVDTFLTAQRFGPYDPANTNSRIKVRFIQPYQMADLGGGLFEVTSTIEMPDPKNDAMAHCTLFPADTLNPEDKLYPNKCTTP